jgi:hypothetical protein
MRRLALTILIIFVGFGCTVRQTGFTLMSTKNVDLSRLASPDAQFARNVECKDSRLWFLFIPLAGNPTLENAVNECLEEANGDYMVSPRIDSTGWSILLFSYGSWHVNGDVGNSKLGQVPVQQNIIIEDN